MNIIILLLNSRMNHFNLIDKNHAGHSINKGLPQNTTSQSNASTSDFIINYD